MECASEIPALEISVNPGPGATPSSPGQGGQLPGSPARRAAAQTGSRHPPVGTGKSEAWERLMDVASLFLQLEWRREKEGCETRPGTQRAVGRPWRGAPQASAHLLPPVQLPRGVRSVPPWRPHWSVRAQNPTPGRCCPVLPQVAARVMLVVVFRLRVPEQHGWGSRSTGRGVAPSWTRRRYSRAVNPKAALEPELPAAQAFYGPSSGRGIRGRGYYRSALTASAAGGRCWAAPGRASRCAFPGVSSWPLTLGTQPPSLRPSCLSAPRRSTKAQGDCQWLGAPENSGSP